VTTNIVLIGLMGSGKTTIGRQLAKLLKKAFHDSDHEIEARTGASIPLIFELEGETGFRKRETAVLDELTRQDNIVLATGGGAVLRDENRELLKSRSVVVYLHAPLEVLVKRTEKDRQRPLLANVDRRAKLDELLKIREPLYRELADVVVNSGAPSAASIAREIVKKLEAVKK
jgi:shikimate kinase